MKKQFQKVWADPVWSKVIAFIITVIISTGYFGINSYINDITFRESVRQTLDKKVSLRILLIIITTLLIIWIIVIIVKRVLGLSYTENHRAIDKELLTKIKNDILPLQGSINFIRENNFGAGAFLNDNISDLMRFPNYVNDPEFEFIDFNLDYYFNKLKKAISRFLNVVSLNTWHVQNPNTNANTVPPEWVDTQPERFNEVVSTIHNAADDICKNYDKLIKLGRRKLGI